MHFLCLPFTNVACSDDIDESGSSDLVIFGNFLVFSFSFSQVQAIIHSFFPKVLLDFGVVTHRLLAYYRQNVFKITGVVHNNRNSLLVLDDDANYVHIISFQLPRAHGVFSQITV